MADNNSIPQDVIDQFDQFGNALRGANDALNRQREAERAIEKAKQDSVEKWNKFSNTLVSSTRAMTTQEGAFNQMGNVTASVVKAMSSLLSGIPVFGSAIKGLGEGAAEAIKLVTQQTSQAFATFGKLSGSGIVNSFQDMRDAAEKTGLLFEEMDSVLAKNSEAFAMFGKTAADGASKMTNILAINRKAAEEAQKMGIGFAEFSEQQASYVAQQIRSGGARYKTDKELAEGARKYSEELDTLSKLTGKQRTDLQKQQEKLLLDARYRAKTRELERVDPAAAKRMKNFITTMPEELQDAMKESFASGGAVVGKASAEATVQLGQMGINLGELTQDVLSGKKDEIQAYGEIANASTKYLDATEQITGIIGKDSALTSNFVALAELSGNAGKEFKEIQGEIERAREAQKAQRDEFAKGATTAHEIASRMQLMLTSSDTIIGINNRVGQSILQLGDLIDKITGKKSAKGPGGESSVTTVSKYAGAAGGALYGAKLGATMGGSIGALFGGVGAAPGAAIGAGIGAVGGGIAGYFAGKKFGEGTLVNDAASAVGVDGTGSSDAYKLLQFTGATGDKAHFDQLEPSVRERFLALLSDPAWGGKPIKIESAYRSPQEQEEIYQRWLDAGGGPNNPTAGGITTPALPVSRGGQLNQHALGRAIDVGTAGLAALEASGLLPKYGFISGSTFSTPDKVHIQAARNGAIVSPTNGGTLMQVGEGGQSEAIIPMPNGKAVPVQFTTDSGVGKLFSEMNDKLETMIDLLSTGNRTQKNMLNSLA